MGVAATLLEVSEWTLSTLTGVIQVCFGVSSHLKKNLGLVKVHSLSSGKSETFQCAACHAFTPHVNAWKK